MRSLADRYRDLMPALLLAREERGGINYYAWIEVTPRSTEAYVVQPGARSGTTTLNWARELNDRVARVGDLVWLRHRDEDGGQLAFEFSAGTSSTTLIIGDGDGSGSGSGSGHGSGGCDFTIGGSGTLCIDEHVTILFGNTVPVEVATNVCPVFTEIDLSAVGDSALRAAALAASSFADFQARVAAL